ncbi:hypothetical protein, partial [Caballeronia sp. INML1]|uniref:hypothetical protein n=1 Tax=Caballeronia sp. INML1 TaxID=2921760 RepID=UPI002028C8B9
MAETETNQTKQMKPFIHITRADDGTVTAIDHAGRHVSEPRMPNLSPDAESLLEEKQEVIINEKGEPHSD